MSSPKRNVGFSLRCSAETIGCLILLIGTLAIYWPATSFDFVNYDDPDYVTNNPHVQGGVTTKGVAWAFHSIEAFNWHPVTWISHMLDCQIYGLRAGGHHLTNILFHCANSLLLFLFLTRLTQRRMVSFFVAALFAWHPLHVESVAWIAERKDVLSSFFGLLTILFYLRYLSSEKSETMERRRAFAWYLGSLICFSLSLMSKPMLVTMPLLLVLVDYWKFVETAQEATLTHVLRGFLKQQRVFIDKFPFLLLAVISGGLTVWTQAHGGAVISTETLPLATRAANMGKILWPSHLAVFYPYQIPKLGVTTVAATVGLILISGATLWLHKRKYVMIGWLWFLVALVPVIGLIQVGMQGMADRYSYFPSVGLFLIAAMGLEEFATKWRKIKFATTGLAIIVLPACLVATNRQLSHWCNSEALFRHAIEVTDRNHVACNNLGTALEEKGNVESAIQCYRKALEFKPDHTEAHNNLGQALMNKGFLAEAQVHFEYALQGNSNSYNTYYNLGNALYLQGKHEAALTAFQKAISLNNHLPQAYNNRGCVLEAQGKHDEAISQFESALLQRPDYVEALNNLGATLLERGKPSNAVVRLKEAVRLKPGYADAHFNMGNAYAAMKSPEAASEYQSALQLNPHHSQSHYKLANLLLAEGNTEAAAKHYRAALADNSNLAEAHYQLATILAARRETAEAIQHYEAAVRLKPSWVEALNNLAWLLATHPDSQFRNGVKAVELAASMVEITGTEDPSALDTLAAAYAETGRFREAAEVANKAVQSAKAQGEIRLAKEIQARLQLYRNSERYRELPR
jgi:protein O-mannosyl-transferase